MKNIYIATKKQSKAREIADKLDNIGMNILSTWVYENDYYKKDKSKEEKVKIVLRDIEEVKNCDILIVISEEDGKNGPGGKHVELGIAIALNKKIYLIGKEENVFHYHPNVKKYDTFDELLREDEFSKFSWGI